MIGQILRIALCMRAYERIECRMSAIVPARLVRPEEQQAQRSAYYWGSYRASAERGVEELRQMHGTSRCCLCLSGASRLGNAPSSHKLTPIPALRPMPPLSSLISFGSTVN